MCRKQLRVLVTGSAGFIGHHLMLALQERGCYAVGLDSLNDYYDPGLKQERLREQGFDRSLVSPGRQLQSITSPHSHFLQADLANALALRRVFEEHRIDIVVNLAAQAGVRHSLLHPEQYVSSNLVGFANLLECCRQYAVKHLVFASSSSVYGSNAQTPFRTDQNTDRPVSFYAATKKANEAMAYSYAHLYGIPTTGLRFFTVYGPWGRPDMAYYLFTNAILENKPISLFNEGEMLRDFTYVDDVVEAISKLLEIIPEGTGTLAPYKLFNVGNNKPEQLMVAVGILEQLLQRKAQLDLQPMQPGDVVATYADVDDLVQVTGFRPKTSLQEGLSKFVSWYLAYHRKPQLVQEL